MENAKILIDHNVSTLGLEDFLETAGRDESDLELLKFFQEEVVAALESVQKVMRDWHRPGAECPLEELRRQFHTLKGAANSIGQLRIGALADGMKSTLDQLNRKQADSLVQDITKASLLTVEAVKSLLAQAMQPVYAPVPRGRLVLAVESIKALRKKIGEHAS
jgi:chemotaxis protein histidine kinase CheA